MGLVNEMGADGNYITSDLSRDLILRKKLGPSREGLYEFELSLQDGVVIFSGVCNETLCSDSQADGHRKYSLDWYFNRLSLPKKMEITKQEVVALITESLIARGWNGIPEKTKDVSVRFKPELLT